MRILTVADIMPNKLGGYEKFMVRLAERCQQEGVFAHFLVIGDLHPEMALQLERAGAVVHIYYGEETFPPKELARLFGSLARQYKFDLVAFHFCTEVAVLLALLKHHPVKYGCRTHFVWHQHSEQKPPTNFVARQFSKLRILSLFLDGVCPLYEKGRETMIQRAIQPRKLHVIYNGVESQVLTPEQVAAKRQELGIAPEEFLLFAAASLIQRKNVAMMIRALSAAQHHHPSLKLAVAGDGDQKQDIEKLIKELGLSDRVVLLGRRSDVRHLIAASDLCLLTSYSEALPYVCLEAFAQAKTVIATPAGGVPEIVTHNKNGLIVPFGDAAALAKEIGILQSYPERKAVLEAQAYQTFQERFSLEVMINNYFQYYIHLIQAS